MSNTDGPSVPGSSGREADLLVPSSVTVTDPIGIVSAMLGAILFWRVGGLGRLRP